MTLPKYGDGPSDLKRQNNSPGGTITFTDGTTIATEDFWLLAPRWVLDKLADDGVIEPVPKTTPVPRDRKED